MATTVVTTYEEAVAALEAQAEEYNVLGMPDERVRRQNEADALQKWLADGRAGECPVDLEQFEIELRDEPAEAEDEEEKPAPPEIEDEAAETETIAAVETDTDADSGADTDTETDADIEAEVEADTVPPVVVNLAADADQIEPDEGASQETVVADAETTPTENGQGVQEASPRDAQDVDDEGTQIESVEHASAEVAQAEAPHAADPDDEDDLSDERLEQAGLRQQVDEAREHLEAGRIGEAYGLSRTLSARITDDGNGLHETVADLFQQASHALNQRLQEELAAGDAAREAGDLEEARAHYQRVVDELDPDNAHARRALLELDNAFSDHLSEEEEIKLRGGLKERKDLRRLGDAVFRAEALDAEGRLTDELAELLEEARERYDEQRRAHGEETTMMRIGDLKARHDAFQRFTDRVAEGEKEILDVTINRWRPASEMLQEATRLYEERSEDTLQYELDRINRALESSYPRWARQRLASALEKPFLPQHRDALEEMLQAVEGQITRQEKAEARLAQADASDDPVEVFDLVLQAGDLFPGMEGLEARVSRARRTALNTLSAHMEAHHKQARSYLQTEENFQKAREEVAAAEALPARWPERDLPAELNELLQAGESLRQQIDRYNELRKEFDRRAERIRDVIVDADRRAEALRFLEELKADERFDEVPALREARTSLDVEIAPYKGLGEQIAQAQALAEQAAGVQTWEQVETLAGNILEAGAGKLADQARSLQRRARRELAIARARRHLANDEVEEADVLLRRLLERAEDDAQKEALRERLETELAEIERVKEKSAALEPLFQQAQRDRQKQGVAERLNALQLFRYAGGMEVDLPDRDQEWPPYHLSLYTVHARRAAREIARELREELLPKLQKVYEVREEAPPDKETLRLLAGQARHLREGQLLESETERAVVRWLEVAYGQERARAKEEVGDWDAAVRIWRELNTHHPRTPVVETNLRRARIRQAIMAAERALHEEDNAEEALSLLREAQGEPGLASSWRLYLALADVHQVRGDFGRAYDALDRAAQHGGKEASAAVAEKRQTVAYEEEVARTLARVRQVTSPREKLEILEAALGREIAAGSARLESKRDEIFTQAEMELRNIARSQQEKGGDEGKIQAVVALVDLRELEDIVGKPDDERRSTPELEPLRAELAPVAKAVAREASRFDPAAHTLDQALSRAAQLTGRLQTFSSVIPLFGEELGDVKEELEGSRSEIGDTHKQLVQLQELLDEAENDALWRDALIGGNFSELEQYQRQIEGLNLSDMLEVRHFRERLEEYQEIYEYLRQQIAEIKKLFSGEEDFEGVTVRLLQLKHRPDLRPRTRRPWRQLLQQDYEDVRHVMSDQMRVVDLYGTGQEIVGWQNVELAAREREEEFKAWQKWDRACERLMREAEGTLQATDQHDSSTTLLQQQREWEAVKQAAERALMMLEQGPRLANGEPVTARSRKATEYEEEGEERHQDAQSWLEMAETRLNTLEAGDTFPTLDEFNEAVAMKNWHQLRQLLARAQRVGTADPQKQQMVATFDRVLNNRANRDDDDDGGILGWLRDLINR